MDLYALKRVFAPHEKQRVRRKIAHRLTEPLHLNLLSLFVALFGSFRSKVNFDLVVRQQYAFPILHAADKAKQHAVRRVTLLEFGVASGAGLLNMCRIAASVTKATGIQFDVVGFDTGTGMPPPIDYRDHPELWVEGDFPMEQDRLREALPAFARLVVGNVRETVPEFINSLSEEAPIGFVALDVDYYSSSMDALEVLKGDPRKYLPVLTLYLDDLFEELSNPWCGELLAIEEFNQQNQMRKISPYTQLRPYRVFKQAGWIDHMFSVHVLDHPTRSIANRRDRAAMIKNEYL